MEAQTVLWWFAVAAICCNVATLLLVANWLLARRSQNGLLMLVRNHAPKIAAIIATVATVGSLYLSEVAHFMPCRYCWIQRIAMYPLALVLLIAWFTKDKGVRRYAVPLAVIGLGFSIWHYLVQRFPDLEGSGSCEVFNPCTLTLTWKFHFISIPYMAGSASALIAVLLLTSLNSDRSSTTAPAE